MQTRIDEIGADMYRLSIFVPEVAPPAGLTFNHFLITGDEPLLFHCGKRKMFPLVSAAVARIMPLERLRWLAFGHFEADDGAADAKQLLQVAIAAIAPVRNEIAHVREVAPDRLLKATVACGDVLGLLSATPR